MQFPLIDVIIPCYNAAQTLERAVKSVLNQPHLGTLWLIDDASTDQTLSLAQQFAAQYPEKINVEQMPRNSGVAKTRNWGALQSAAEIIAFLDADDAYEPEALTLASSVFHFRPEIQVLRLALNPVGIAERYSAHPNFDFAWQHMRMTCGGNVVFRRAFFLACGGFPQHQLFRELGGEDGALGIATTQVCQVGTLFNEPGVLHYCRDGMHAERLLDAILFNKIPPDITDEKMNEAQAVTDKICQQMRLLRDGLTADNVGVIPLALQRE
ncbi:Putative lipooligosaccharide biosynthesis protein [Actinobacillus porcinus]|uniref:Lipooligosaccharide biosynthesis protein n=1 Tax=Actinobacillus porcinus TaxID=51048 RepID=A0ABY6THT6_9PAST|nr:glycosyltransferase family A protein [Actinobacillus porcinus]VFY92478.1 Putative lipooligosaccharide biosynthesis protein [Actinobacillus porcinus]VTU06480.1 Putative lipooligosaccharide biosynthesis protein [Actinobacillus porcinus]